MVYTWHSGLNGNYKTWVQKSWKMTLEGNWVCANGLWDLYRTRSELC